METIRIREEKIILIETRRTEHLRIVEMQRLRNE